MEITCPAPYLPPSCWDITKAAGSDATLAGLLTTVTAAIIVLVLQAPKRTSFEQETRNTVLTILVSTFFSALVASFIFGLLTGEMPTIRALVLIDIASPALAVSVLQLLLSIGWLLTSHQAEAATLTIARWAFLLVNGLIILFLALNWEDLLVVKTQGAFPALIYAGAGILGALLIGTIAWAIATWLKRRFASEESKRRREAASNAHRCAKIGLFFAAGSTLLFGIISDFSGSLLQNGPDWVYYLGVISLMALVGGFVCVSAMSWPPLPPASPPPQKNHAEATLDHELSGVATSPPIEESTTPSAKKQPITKLANLGVTNSRNRKSEKEHSLKGLEEVRKGRPISKKAHQRRKK
jgi:hypothetical protein